MDMPALCPQNVFSNLAGFLCGLQLCGLLPSISCCKDGLNLSLVLEVAMYKESARPSI